MKAASYPRRSHRLAYFWFLTFATLAGSATRAAQVAQAETPDVDRLLAEVKAALGGEVWDRVAAMRTAGTLRTSGLEGTAVAWEELTTGRFVNRYDLGITSGAEGFDGEAPWQEDDSGAVTLSDSQGDVEGAVNQAYLVARGFWFPDRRPGEVRYLRRAEEEARSFHVLEIYPRGGRRAELWIDAATGRPDRVSEEGANRTTTNYLSDYREVEGLWLPFAVRTTTGEARYDTHFDVTAVELFAEAPEGTFARPASEIADVELLGGGDSAEIPFRLENNHIYVLASVNGSAPRNFLVDTGGANVLTRRAAAALGIEAQGAIEVQGVGEETADVGMARVEAITVGGVRLVDQTFIVIDMDEIVAAEGIEFSGLVGFELFRRFVVEIDYARERLVLTRPEAFRYQGSGTSIMFRFDGRTPVVDGAVDGIAGTFALDTGSRGSLSLHRPFVETNDLESRYSPRFERLTGWGVGGGARGQAVRPVTLTLGGLEIPGVATVFSLQSSGAFTDRYVAGNVGGAVLERFRVIFDYANQKLYLEPNEHYDDPEGADRSGLWINRVADGLLIVDVVGGGPAEAAGLRVGERIVAVDGVAYQDLSLSAIREAWRRAEPGTGVALTLRSGGETREVRIVLRDLF